MKRPVCPRASPSGARALIACVFLALITTAVQSHPGRVDQSGCHQSSGGGKKHCHPERSNARAPKFDPDDPPRPGDEGVFFGPVVRVGDGDTLHVKVQGVVMEFRLSEVDAPELRQPYGNKARAELNSLVSKREVVLMPFDTDRYGRTVAHVWAGNVHVNYEMVRRGAAWFYDAYSRGDALYHVEQAARDAKRGLWALPLKDRVEPWVWRREAR